MDQTSNFLKSFKDYNPDFAIIIGSGLGSILTKIKIEEKVPYKTIPGFPQSTVKGHAGEMIFGKLGGHKVLVFNGRVHYYEGYSMKEVTMNVRVANEFKVKGLIISNASGAVNPALNPGDIMIIKDHVNFIFADNPLRGEKGNERFVNMTEAYDAEYRRTFKKVAEKRNIDVREGVYCSVMGSNYETIAELNLMHRLGIDAVGMSTVPEVIVARFYGIKVLGLSCITDNVFSEGEVSHEKVIKIAEKSGVIISQLAEDFLEEIK
jgi:purine-nucleoside phosphorylase